MNLIEQEAQAWVVRLDSKQVTADDAQAFKDWCACSQQHASAFVQARGVWLAMRPAAQRVARRGAGESRILTSRPRMDRRAFFGTALAAAVGYLAVRPPMQLWPALNEWGADYSTGKGEQREVMLADGSVIQMNTMTRINLTAGEARSLELLGGEVEVQAAPGTRRIDVLAGGGRISGDDARFNVRQDEKDVCVTCLAGRVDIVLGAQRAVLENGSQMIYREGRFGLRQEVNLAVVTAWRQRLLLFNQIPLSTVIAEVNRYRPGKLVLVNAELGRNQVQASLSMDHLDDVIALIRDVYGAQVTHLPAGVILFG